MTSNVKTIFLIRHAESLENERLACLTRSFRKMGSFKLPTKSDLYRSAELLNVYNQIDSPVSDVGQDQINQVGESLRKDNFLIKNNIQLIAHSPLLRARQTCEGMLRCVATPSNDLPSPVKRVEELSFLIEKTPSEWLPGNLTPFINRIKEFEAWICNQPETNIAIVGHSQFFKKMLELNYKFGNCDVWQLSFDCNHESENCAVGDLPRGWRDMENLYKYERKEIVN